MKWLLPSQREQQHLSADEQSVGLRVRVNVEVASQVVDKSECEQDEIKK
jgi:hypothetical protein